MNIDRFDKSILAALQKDGRISNVQLASQVNLSESACLRRVRALEDGGLIVAATHIPLGLDTARELVMDYPVRESQA